MVEPKIEITKADFEAIVGAEISDEQWLSIISRNRRVEEEFAPLDFARLGYDSMLGDWSWECLRCGATCSTAAGKIMHRNWHTFRIKD